MSPFTTCSISNATMPSAVTTASSNVTMPVHTLDPGKALESATERFIKANVKSKEVFENASKHLPAGNTRTTLFAPPFPISAVSGSGSEIVLT